MNKWPSDKIERKPTHKLIPYARNSRTHSEEQIGQIAASIKEWGFTTPILVDEDNEIIAGHGRLLAAQKLDIKEVPVMVAEDWTEAQKKAYVIADNKLALNAGWDNEMLKVEIDNLKKLDFDINLTGFNLDELSELFPDDELIGLTDENEVPNIPENPITIEGDTWVLGNHRLICGSSTDPLIVDQVLKGVKPHLMVTDPPYGVEYDPNFRNGIKRANGSIVSARAVGKVNNDDNADWSEAWALFTGDVAYVWHAGIYAGVVADSLIKNDFNIRSQIIWSKSNFAIGRGAYHWKHEPCWYAVKKNQKGHYSGDRKQTTVWEIPKPQKSETGHSTQKPIDCMKKPIENNSSIGQAIYEPFCGSGTTIIACEQTGRHCYAIELNPAYVDVAVTRWQNFTGKDAVHAETGVKFNNG